MKKMIDKFNDQSVNLVISEWPDLSARKKSYHGVAGFTRDTLLTLSKRHNLKFVVLAEKNGNNQPRTYAHGKILVLRVFDHKHPSLYPTILYWLKKFPKIHKVTVHSEFGACFGLKHFILLLPFLLLIKVTGRSITYFAHNVVEDISFLKAHLGLNFNKFTANIFNFLLILYYKTLAVFCDEIVVLDINSFRTLNKNISHSKVRYFPLYVKPRVSLVSAAKAKNVLGLTNKKVIMSFGFISWYKGSDLLAKLFTKVTKNDPSVQLVFAGSKHITLEKKLYYTKYYSEFNNSIKNFSNILLTGFIPENELGLYFAAADIVVLSYRGLMGGSAALNMAIGFGKPFMVSENMANIWRNPDIKNVLKNSKTNPKSLMFPLTKEGINKVLNITRNESRLRKIKRLSIEIRNIRRIDRVCDAIYNDLYAINPVDKNPNWILPYAKIYS